MKFHPPEFKENLNKDLYIEWVHSLERFFENKEYSENKAFKIVVLILNKCDSLWYVNTRDKEIRKASLKSELGPS